MNVSTRPKTPKKKRLAKSKVRKTGAHELVRLLADKHKDDIFHSELSLGGKVFDYGPDSARLDAWAAACSWATPRYFGYEIKVSRSDFTNDDKWPRYLPATTYFSFVCPWGLITPDELPDKVGLICMNQAGTGLITRRKPLHRKLPESSFPIVFNMMKAVLMKRRIGIDDDNARKRWLQEKAENRKLGRLIAPRVGAQIIAEREQIVVDRNRLEKDQKRWKAKIEETEQATALIRELTGSSHGVRRSIDPDRAKAEMRARIEAHNDHFRTSPEIKKIDEYFEAAEKQLKLAAGVVSNSRQTIERFKKLP